MKKRKIIVGLLALGLFGGLATLGSTAITPDAAYANIDETATTQPEKKKPEKYGGVFNGVSEGDLDYVKAEPSKATSELTEVDEYYSNMPTNMKYPEFNGYSNFSFNPDTKPISRAGSDIVDEFIELLQVNSLYSETGRYSDNENPGRYILGVDASTRKAASVDLLGLAQDIQRKTGVKTLVYTVNHYTTRDLPGKNVLMFSDHADIAKEVQELDGAAKKPALADDSVKKKTTSEAKKDSKEDDSVNGFIPLVIIMISVAIVFALVVITTTRY